MRRSLKFTLLFIGVLIVMTVVFGVIFSYMTSRMEAEVNLSVTEIVALVREKYPDISDNEIADILNNRYDYDLKSNQSILREFSIDYNQSVLGANREKNKTIILCLCTFFVSGMILLGVMWLYMRSVRKNSARLTNYLAQLNSGNYYIDQSIFNDNSDSILDNEIYKTTIMLREQNELINRDKLLLKDSISDISHQLKTPLTSVMIMTDSIIEDENMPDEVKKDFLNDIRGSLTNISFLVQSLLTLSKLEADSIVFSMKDEKLRDILVACTENNALIAEIREVKLKLECNENIIINCDKRWFTEALTNIVKNCIEHTAPGGHVSVSGSDKTMFTTITISDNGCGISQADMPHIFERFYKTDKSDENSVGIGLAISRAIIEKHGGTIKAVSKENEGTVFTIKLY